MGTETEAIAESEFFDNLNDVESALIKSNKKIEYYDIPAAFDIETTSFYDDNGNKCAIMYEWTFAIYSWVVTGRTWDEFMSFYDRVVKTFLLNENRRLIVYVHNLAFEFQFIRKRFAWRKVFALDERKPISALTLEGVEFRCSYKLSGYSLAKLGDQLVKYKIHKLVGDIDYYKKRHCKSVLTSKEIQYCVNDVLVVNAYIQELIENNKHITQIPLTKTGFVRRYCRDACLYDKKAKYANKFRRYRELMKILTLDVETYSQLKRAFAGGFTHASPLYAFDTVENVRSFDFTSSYPYVMVSEKFPMGRATPRDIKSAQELEKYLHSYCCLFDIEFFDLEPKIFYENYISVSHCYECIEVQTNNGRVVRAKHIMLTVTEIDYEIIRQFYSWGNSVIYNFKTFEMGYLPTDFVKSILDLYVKKTTLKEVEGKESEYLRSKEDINSAYGMCVTDICRDEILYNSEWGKEKPNIEEALDKNNRSVRRFLYYPWGVWVTAYARANLFTGITEFQEDYLYSDTDSIKVVNAENHMDYIYEYNAWVLFKLQLAMEYHHLDMSLTAPKNIKGEVKQLGLWSDEGVYTRFKSLGAKRYMTEKWNDKSKRFDISITVSGINKKTCVPYLLSVYGRENCFAAFNEDLSIPAETILKGDTERKVIRPTGKLTHTYIDTEIRGVMVDDDGIVADYEELSGVHLEPAGYDFSLSSEYVRYVMGIKDILK